MSFLLFNSIIMFDSPETRDMLWNVFTSAFGGFSVFLKPILLGLLMILIFILVKMIINRAEKNKKVDKIKIN